jgi:hypothetical protein
MGLFREASLLIVLTNACSSKTSPQLEILRSTTANKIQAAANPDPGTIEASMQFFPPWLSSSPPIQSGSFEADESSWRKVVIEILRIFSQAGPKGKEALWTALEYESLPTRLIFGQLVIEFYSREGESFRREIEPRLSRWVELGLISKDNESRYVALAAIANLNLREHKNTVRKVAETDEDPIVRERARRVLTGTFLY